MNSASNGLSDSAAAGIVGGLILVYCVVILAVIAVTIWIYWRIFAKAGFNGALAFLNLIPGVGPLICILILAFGRWPIEDQLAAARAGGSAYPPSAPPPGSSVMST
jgi:uncharacterized membrane protein YhaH (DUF805 family)